MIQRAPAFTGLTSALVVEPNCGLRSTRYQSYGKKLRTYIELPAFSVENVWRGASEILLRFDFDASSFSGLTKSFPRTAPSGANFCPVISWLKDEVYYRYKLWSDVGEILWLPDYAGEKVTSDFFSIEIWNTNTTQNAAFGAGSDDVAFGVGDVAFGVDSGIFYPLTLATGIQFYTTRLVVPDCCCESADIAEGEATTCVDPIYSLDGFIPLFGDYYLLVSPCSRLLVHGSIVTPAFNILESTDGTWHEIYAETVDGGISFHINQDAVAPQGKGYFAIIRNDVIYKVALQEQDGNHYLSIIETLEEETEAGTVFLLLNQDDALNYGLYLDTQLNFAMYPTAL